MASNGWRMAPVTREFTELWKANNPDVEAPRMYTKPPGLSALVGREPFGSDGSDLRWHISLRYGDPGHDGRIPTWEEMVQAAHELRPGVVFVIGIPPRSWWMNVHPHVLHMHETNDAALIEQYKANAMAAVPT